MVDTRSSLHGRGTTIASRYLDAVASRRRQDAGERHPSAVAASASSSSHTPERPPSKNKALNESYTSSGMTVTTAGLDVSSSWSSKDTPSRSAERTPGRKSGLTHRPFSATSPDKPLGVEDDCSSIESSSSHRRNRATHLQVSMDQEPLSDNSLERRLPYQSYPSGSPPRSPPRTAMKTSIPSPSRLLKKAREHLAKRRVHSAQSRGNRTSSNQILGCATPGDLFPRTTPKRRDYGDGRVPPSPYEMRRVGTLRSSPGHKDRRRKEDPGYKTRSRWESKRFADEEGPSLFGDDEGPPLSEAGAPTEIMTNLSSDILSHAAPPSESEAATEVMTNRAVDVIRRLHPVEPPSVRRWHSTPYSTKDNTLNISLIDAMSTNEESSALSPDNPYSRALFDVHSPSFSVSTDNTSRVRSPRETQWQQQQRVNLAPSDSTKSDGIGKGTGTSTRGMTQNFGGLVGGRGAQAIAARSAARGPQVPKLSNTDQVGNNPEAMGGARYFMPEETMFQPRIPQETSSGEVTSSVSTTDKLLMPGTTKDKSAISFIRYNSRETPNAHEVFQRRYSADESSDASTISTLDKEAYPIPENPIQPLFSLDRLDMSHETQSPIRKHHGTSSNLGPHSSQEVAGDGAVIGTALEEPYRLRRSSNTATRFAVKRDSPDPIFCVGGSISTTSYGIVGSVGKTPGHEAVVTAGRSAHWPTVSRSESEGTGYETELVQIMETRDIPRQSAPLWSNPLISERTSTVKEKIHAFNKIPPDQWTNHPDSLSPNRPQSNAHIAVKVYGRTNDEKKDKDFDHRNYDDDDDDTVSVKSLREKFENNELGQHPVPSRDGGEEDDDNASVKSLRDKFERPLQIQHDEDDMSDERSVRSLQKKFEVKPSVKKRQQGQRVSNLKSLFESKMVAHAKGSRGRFKASQQVTLNESYKPSQQVVHIRNKAPSKAVVDQTSRNGFDNGTKRGPYNDVYPSKSADNIAENEIEVTLEPPVDFIEDTPAQEVSHLSSQTQTSKHSLDAAETVHESENKDIETSSSSSSKVRGPSHTSFLSMRQRLLQFSKSEPDPFPSMSGHAEIQQQKKKSRPPSMKQRLHQWATRNQERRSVSPESTGRLPSLLGNERRGTTSTVDAVDPAKSEDYKAQKKSTVASTHTPVFRTIENNEMAPELKIDHSDSGSTTKAHFLVEQESTTSDQGPVTRDDKRGRSGDTEDSDGVTLDASIADVSTLSDPTCIKTKSGKEIDPIDYVLGAKPRLSPSPVPGTDILAERSLLQPQVTNTGPSYSTGSAANDQSHPNAMPASPLDDAQKLLERHDSGWDLERVSKSFSYDGSKDKSLVTSDGSDALEVDIAWPPIDDARWFDFSSDYDHKNSDEDFGTTDFQRYVANESLKQEHSAPEQDHIIQEHLPQTTPSQTANENDGFLLYSHIVGRTPSKTDSWEKEDLGHESRTTRERDDGDKVRSLQLSPSSQSNLFEKRVVKDVIETQPGDSASKRRFFARTNPPARMSDFQSMTSRSEPRTIGTNPSTTGEHATSRSMPRSLANFSTKSRIPTNPSKNQGPGLFSRVAWSMSRSSRTDTLVSRLKSMQSSRSRRKKPSERLPSHKPLKNEDDGISALSNERVKLEMDRPGSYRFATHHQGPTARRRQPRDPPALKLGLSPPRRGDPPAAKKHKSRTSMDMRSIIPPSEPRASPSRISKRQLQVQNFNSTSTVTNFFKIEPPRPSFQKAVPVAQNDDIRHRVGIPPPPPPHSAESIARIVGRPPPPPPRQERPAIKFANDVLKAYSSPSLPNNDEGRQVTKSLRARYYNDDGSARPTLQGSTYRQPDGSRPRVRFQEGTHNPPLPKSTQPSYSRSSQTVQQNPIATSLSRQPHEQGDRASSASSSTSGFSEYLSLN